MPHGSRSRRDAGGHGVVKYVRLYTDAEGESRFDDVPLQGETRGVHYDSELVARFSDAIIGQPKGESEVGTSTGEVRRFGPGAIMLLEDIDGKGHIARRVSDGERLTLLITLPDDPTAWPPGADAREAQTGGRASA